MSKDNNLSKPSSSAPSRSRLESKTKTLDGLLSSTILPEVPCRTLPEKSSKNTSLRKERNTITNLNSAVVSSKLYKMPDISQYLKSGKTINKHKPTGDHNSIIKDYM